MTTPKAPARPELFGDGAEDIVGLDGGDDVRVAEAEALARDSAGLDCVAALERLIAGAAGLGLGVAPDIDAGLHVRERKVAEHSRDPEEHHPGEYESKLTRSHVECADSEEHEQRNAPEVLEQSERAHGDEEGQEEWNDVGQRAVRAIAEADSRRREHCRFVGEVPGEEDEQEQLDELGCLDALPGDGEP